MNEECVIGVRHDAEIKNLQEKTEELREVDDQQWTAINALRNRLPPWAVAAASLGAALIGVLATLIAAG